MPTAAALIIGDEILAGKFTEENSGFLIRRCRELGLEMKRVCFLPDESAAIIPELQSCAAAYDFVFTTGGVGPTHDDITMRCVAEAFARPLQRHASVEALIRQHARQVNEASLRMADLPESCVLHPLEGLWVPLVSVENVYIFPGIPSLLRMKFNAAEHLWVGGIRLHQQVLRTELYESQIAPLLSLADQRWSGVKIGSYPRMDEPPRHVLVTLEAAEQGPFEACLAFLQEGLQSLEAQLKS